MFHLPNLLKTTASSLGCVRISKKWSSICLFTQHLLSTYYTEATKPGRNGRQNCQSLNEQTINEHTHTNVIP